MSQSIKPFQNLPRNLWALTAGSFLTDISSEMIVHLIPLFLANVLKAGTAAIGLIEGVAETTASLLKIVSGQVSDRLGTRKGLVIAGYSLSTFSKPFLALVNTWPGVLAVRFFERLGKGLRTAPRDALIADSISSEQRGLAFGLHRAGDTAGATLGLLAALVVVWFVQRDQTTLSAGTFTTLVWLSLVPAALAVLVLVLAVREKKPASATGAAPLRLAWGDLDRRFRWFLLVVVIFTFGNTSDAFLALRAQERGASVAGVLGMLVVFNLVYTLVSIPASALSDRLGRRRVLLAGWLLYALVYAGFALAQSAVHVWVLYGLYGIYYGICEGTAKALVADLVAPSQRGTAYGWYSGAIGLAALPANVLAGLLWQGMGGWVGFGPAAPFVFGAGMALLAALILLWVLPARTQPV